MHSTYNQDSKPRFHRSVLFSCVLAASLPVAAQTESSGQSASGTNNGGLLEEIVVKGLRQSLQNAQTIKREADTFVDAISSSDIGALPDRSILESIQRIPGVQIGRFASPEDPDHFGTEGSGLIIRGLTQVRSEFNGRDTFSASSGSGLSFSDVPPELIGNVLVYKNQTADMVEGGIGGTVSLNTRKPFDSKGRHFGITVDGQVNTLDEDWTPTISALFSDRMDTEFGEFGVLLSVADSTLEQVSHGMQSARYELRPIAGDSPGHPGFDYVPESSRYVYDGSFAGAPEGMAVGDEGVIVPLGGNVSQKFDRRERNGIAASLQWESPDQTLRATAEFIRSDASLSWTEYAIRNDVELNDPNARPVADVTGSGEDFSPAQWQFSEEGIFQNGSISSTSAGWRAEDPTGRIPQNADWATTQVNEFGPQYSANTRYRDENRLTEDASFNLQWTPTDAWEISADYQHVNAETEIDDHQLIYVTRANVDMALDAVGSGINMRLENPWSFATEEEIQSSQALQAEGVDLTSSNYFQQDSSFVAQALMDFVERSEGELDAFRLDGTRFLDNTPFLTAVKFGARYAKKTQSVGATRFNWAPIRASFNSPIGWLDDPDVVSSGLPGTDQIVDWSGFEAGDGFAIQGGNQMLHPAAIKDREAFQDIIQPLVETRCDTSRLLSERIDPNQSTVVDGVCNEAGAYDIVNGFFRPDEIFETEEESVAAYVRLDFASEIMDRRLAGNIGLRHVEIETLTTGATQFPGFSSEYPVPEGTDVFSDDLAQEYGQYVFNDLEAGIDIGGDGVDPRFLGEVNNFLPEEVLAFANNGTSPRASAQTTDHWLPSLNLKYELTDDLLLRFAASKAISKPDIGQRRNYISIQQDTSEGGTTVSRTRLWGPQVDEDGNAILDENGNQVIEPFPYISSEYPDNVNAAGEPIPDGIPEANGENLEQVNLIRPGSVDFSGFSASSGNPFLEPTESDQFDLSLEWFFSDVGSLTTTVFYKDLKNYIVSGSRTEQITNPETGATQTVRISGPENGSEGEIKGFEIAYQQTYDSLPSPFNGLGIQANYTYIDSEGIPNQNFSGIDPEAAERNTAFDDLPLERLSDHVANLVAFYQKGPAEVRLAYNWNSEFLLTARDEITTLPVWNDAQGFLDASFKYDVTDRFRLSFEAKNLNNEEVVTRIQVDNDLKLFRSSFVQGRSYILKASYSF